MKSPGNKTQKTDPDSTEFKNTDKKGGNKKEKKKEKEEEN